MRKTYMATLPSGRVTNEAPGPSSALPRSTGWGAPAEALGSREVVVAEPVAGTLELVNRWPITLEAKARSTPEEKRMVN